MVELEPDGVGELVALVKPPRDAVPGIYSLGFEYGSYDMDLQQCDLLVNMGEPKGGGLVGTVDRRGSPSIPDPEDGYVLRLKAGSSGG